MILKLVLFVLLMAQPALAEFDVELSRHGSGQTFTNNFSTSYSIDSWVDQQTNVVGVNNYFEFLYSSSSNLINLNSAYSDFSVIEDLYKFNYIISFFEKLTMAAGYGYSIMNSNEVEARQYTYGLSYQFNKVQLGINFSDSHNLQLKSVVILNREMRDEIRFGEKDVTYSLSYQITENILTRLSGVYYSYDEDLNKMNTLLTTQLLLDRAGPSMASNIQGQLKNSVDLAFIYSYDENWIFNISLGKSKDYLAPESQTSSIDLGFEYENSLSVPSQLKYKIFAKLSSSKAEDVDGVSSSGLAGVSFSF